MPRKRPVDGTRFLGTSTGRLRGTARQVILRYEIFWLSTKVVEESHAKPQRRKEKSPQVIHLNMELSSLRSYQRDSSQAATFP